MAETVVIRLPVDMDAALEWVVVDLLSIGDPQAGLLAEAAPHFAGRSVIVLAPANEVLRLRIAMPLKGNARIRQALPYALEEQLASDIDEQHFAFSSKDADGRLAVAVIANELLSAWLARFREIGINPTAMYAESDALETLPATMTVLLDNEEVIIRDGRGDITVADEYSMQTVLELLLDRQTAELEDDATIVPVALRIYCDNPAYERHAETWERLRMRAETLDIELLPNGALPLLAGHITTHPGVNLLQGAYAPKSEIPIQWENWRLAAMLLGAFVVLGLGAQGLRYWQLSSANAALDAAATEVMLQTFPDSEGSDDPWNLLDSRLGVSEKGEAQSTVSFAEALEALSTAFEQTPGIELQALSFRSGVLDLQLVAPDVAALDQLRKLVGQSGRFAADIQSANPTDDAIKGRIQIVAANES